ncbi:hypothetical protein C0Q70_11812 [Pomacea canaliculata]|uniref:Oligomycin sensitivity conferral protein n=1 Tax=Pomacea canaliculata TaxID=400727 RepID=A0A2T7P711_POMCA|nr:hypothetical protein C0Q70_11812 [Pomacea canaliculata]
MTVFLELLLGVAGLLIERGKARGSLNKELAKVRQFGTSAVQNGKLVTPPIQVFGIEGRYATALYSAASKEKKLDVVEKESKSLQELLRSDKKFREFVTNPSLQRVQKKAVLETVMKPKYSPLMINLLAAMADNGRIAKIGGVLTAFGRIMSAHRGEVICNVTTAKPLDTSSLGELKKALQGFLKKGETLHLTMEVDPSLIGGMQVSIGDRYIDMSMASKIKNYTNLLSKQYKCDFYLLGTIGCRTYV